jgi:hypothetical protein
MIQIATGATGKIYRGALKHTNIKIKHLEQVAHKTIIIKYCSTNEMLVDLLIQGLTYAMINLVCLSPGCPNQR